MTPEEATRLVKDHCTVLGLGWGSSIQLDAWETAQGWDVGPRTDPTDINTLVIGGTRFLVTLDGTIHEGSGSLPPRIRWDHVPSA